MKQNDFKKALSDFLVQDYENSIPSIEKHQFSSEFENKMDKLIKIQKKPYYYIFNTLAKRIACISIILIIGASASIYNVKALRNLFENFFIKTFESGSMFNVDDTTNSPETIEDIYNITYDLSDFDVVFEENLEWKRSIIFKSETNSLIYNQYTKLEFNSSYNTQNVMLESISINELEVIYFLDNYNYHNLIWDNGEYIISICSNINKKRLFEIVESVEKVE